MKLHLLYIWWLSHWLVLQIDGHCLRQWQPAQKSEAAEAVATRHMWQPTGLLADTGSCADPTTLRPATDSHVAVVNATATAPPAVSLGNYVYQCLAKRAPSPPPDLASIKSLRQPLQLLLQLGQRQQ